MSAKFTTMVEACEGVGDWRKVTLCYEPDLSLFDNEIVIVMREGAEVLFEGHYKPSQKGVEASVVDLEICMEYTRRFRESQQS